MDEVDEADALAAEYVLGTLDAREREAVALRREREEKLDGAIIVWERRLGPLAETADPVAPRADLFDRISLRVEGQRRRGRQEAGV
jgi:anti-sigma-K factor RskA